MSAAANPRNDQPGTLRVTDREGVEHRLATSSGQSLMLVLNRAELGVEGVCGGCCVCATCHVYIDDSQGRLPPVAADEAMLLDGLMERNDHSRLACQLTCDDMPEDLLIRIAPAE